MPERSCAACGRKAPKSEFLRLARSSEGLVAVGGTGRGAHLCRERACIEKAFKRKLLPRRLRVEANGIDWQRLETELLEKLNRTHAEN
jgi:predicted RNA-binding protein YlxR (DUF448 family)